MKGLAIKLAISTMGLLLVGLLAVASPTYAQTPGKHTGGTAPQAPETCGLAWRTVTTPATDSMYSELEDIEALSADNVWTVGYEWLNDKGYPLALHRAGETWSKASLPDTGPGYLTKVSAASASDIWAVGSRTTQLGAQTLILHYNGTTWAEVSSPHPGAESWLYGVVALSANNAFAVGEYRPGDEPGVWSRPLILKWDGATWTTDSVADLGAHITTLYGVDGSSPSEVWAVGRSEMSDGSDFHPLVLKRQGNQWVSSPLGNAGNLVGSLRSIAVDSSNLIWAAGYHRDGADNNTLVLRWNGSSWSAEPSYSAAGHETALQDIDTKQGTGLAVGYERVATDAGDRVTPLILHHVANTWMPMSAQEVGPIVTVLEGISIVSANSDVWTAGGYNAALDQEWSDTLVQRYNDPCANQPACNLQFSDVPTGSTFYPYVRCLACQGVLGGYANGTFKPGNNVTRGQLAKIVANAADFNEQSGPTLFADVAPGSTYFDYVQRLAFRGIIGGYTCGGPGEPCLEGNPKYFRPNQNATRGQIAKIVSDAAGFNDVPGAQMFEDVAPGSPFFDWVQRLASRNALSGYPCGGTGEACGGSNLPYFRPNQNTT
ncbi:MAG: hypothetical protein QOH93_3369, partial [Chloroflexia bacterium]|nr:hypothetical protein [Chloroflexia bacterium]